MLVEVKTTPTTEDVKDHIRRLEKMRKYADLHGNSGLKSERTFFGAVAGVVIKKEHPLGVAGRKFIWADLPAGAGGRSSSIAHCSFVQQRVHNFSEPVAAFL